ncbi:MAG: peptidoglycan DD-metalloendopeptidase family protein, partial [Gammaproteobacteria bacterium]|nr:peptidoglycan DD-metalloendopeptidase family protein [Gammaproteobacteria bacterium]
TTLPVPGGIAVVDLNSDFDKQSRAYFEKRRILTRKINNQWQAMVGLPLNIKPGIHKISTTDSQGKKKHYQFSVSNKDYETRHITIKNKRMVSPTKKDIERHYKEKPLIVAALKEWTENNNVQTNFITPVEGRFSSIFGLKRIYNNQKRIRRHTGLDIAAPVGTTIKSPAIGQVIRTGSYFFTGNTVFIDHGQGLISMYSHLNETHVKAGQQLDQGQPIGTVGMTGRVSGPHLHWVISLNNTKVDPKLFLAKDVFNK